MVVCDKCKILRGLLSKQAKLKDNLKNSGEKKDQIAVLSDNNDDIKVLSIEENSLDSKTIGMYEKWLIDVVVASKIIGSEKLYSCENIEPVVWSNLKNYTK